MRAWGRAEVAFQEVMATTAVNTECALQGAVRGTPGRHSRPHFAPVMLVVFADRVRLPNLAPFYLALVAAGILIRKPPLPPPLTVGRMPFHFSICLL